MFDVNSLDDLNVEKHYTNSWNFTLKLFQINIISTIIMLCVGTYYIIIYLFMYLCLFETCNYIYSAKSKL